MTALGKSAWGWGIPRPGRQDRDSAQLCLLLCSPLLPRQPLWCLQNPRICKLGPALVSQLRGHRVGKGVHRGSPLGFLRAQVHRAGVGLRAQDLRPEV